MLGHHHHHHHHHDNNNSSSRTQQLVSYVQDYLECVESLPLDIQRNVSLLREIDSKYQEVLKEVDDVYERYRGEQDASQRKRLQLQLQRALIASQELGDEKIGVVTQMTELVENRSRQMDSHALQGLQEAGVGGGDTPDRPTSTATDRRSASAGLLLPEGSSSSSAAAEQQRSSARRPRRQQRTTSESRDSSFSLAPPNGGGGGGSSSLADEPGGGAEDPVGPSALASSSSGGGGSSSSAQQQQSRGGGGGGGDSKKSKSAGGGGGGGSSKKKKRKSAKQDRTSSSASAAAAATDPASPPLDLANVDPDEPTYCLCEQVSYGEMIGCDNEQCPIEWFHFSCVGLTYKPKGKWFCPRCRGDSEKTMDKGLAGRKERRSR